MFLAVRKEEGSIPGGGFNYFMHPLELKGTHEAALFQTIGYIVIEVPEDKGKELLEGARAALCHQIEVAHWTEKTLAGKK